MRSTNQKIKGFIKRNSGTMNHLETIKEIENIFQLQLINNANEPVIYPNSYSLDKINNVISLSLSGSKIVNLNLIASQLKKMPFLQHLELDDTEINDLTPIRDLVNLARLEIGINKITDISPIKNLKKLTSLDLSNNEIKDISVLKHLVNLENLNISNLKVRNIDVLATLKKIRNLNLKSLGTGSKNSSYN